MYNITKLSTRVETVILITYGMILFYRCLHKTCGILQLKTITVCKLVVACAVLHNRATTAHLPHPVDDNDDGDDDGDVHHNNTTTGILCYVKCLGSSTTNCAVFM